MATSAWKKHGKPAIDLLEEAVHLLRRLRLSTWVIYYCGTLPFVLALLFYWSDMSRGAFAREHVAGYSLILAMLYVWMKCWQSVACSHMEALLAGDSVERWTPGRIARNVVGQTVLQPIALVALPLAALITLPFAWIYAYFQNCVIVSRGDSFQTRDVALTSRSLALLWPRQNHLGLVVILIFGFFVWINLAVALLVAPLALRTLLGIETALSRGFWTLLNTTFFVCVCGAAYLAVDPLIKAFYVLRCFYGNALRSGRDLRVDLRRLRQSVMLLIAGLGMMIGPSAHADTTPDHERLERSIEQTLDRPEFSWRLPRASSNEQKGLIASFVEDAIKSLTKMFAPMKEWFRRVVEWLERYFQPSSDRDDFDLGGLGAWAGAAEKIIYVLSGIAVALASFLVWKRWKQDRRGPVTVAIPMAARPDLEAEDTMATLLPEEEWMRLAEEMIARSEFRLAFRALYLAGLAHLSQRDFLTIARHKSNREYEREFARRARPAQKTERALHSNVAAFERVWYGRHPARAEDLPAFSANLEELRAL